MKLSHLDETFNRLFQIPLKLINYDPNKDNRERYREPIQDSNTRAMSAVLGIPYEETLEEQFKTAAFLRCQSNHIAVMDFMMEKHGYQIYKIEKPYSVLTFIMNNPEGRYLVNTEDGSFAVVNATVIDIHSKDILNTEYLESVLCRLVKRVYELAPIGERYIMEGDPGKGSLTKVKEESAKENVEKSIDTTKPVVSSTNSKKPKVVKSKKTKSTKKPKTVCQV